jgi:glycosyltransferase involved in cell wall biosynthesis
MVARVAALARGVGAVVASARVAERSRPRRRALERWTHWLVDAEVCVSNGVRDYLGAGGFPREKLTVIPNGVEAGRYGPPSPAFKATLGVRPEQPLVTTVGRLHEQKGMAYFLRAAASVRHSRPDCHFLLVGHGPLEDELRRLAEEFRIADRVTFLGFCDDVPAVLAATDVFVLASLWEGMPNAVLEAMAAGVPVVATRVEGTVDIIEDGKTGLVVLPRDIPGLVTAVLRLLEDPTRARALAEAGQAHVREHFPLDAMVRRHEQLYADLLRGGGRR